MTVPPFTGVESLLTAARKVGLMLNIVGKVAKNHSKFIDQARRKEEGKHVPDRKCSAKWE